MPHLRALLRELIETENLRDYVLWFYTPMALPLADELQPRAVVYDCMDELSAFKNAPPQLLRARGRAVEAGRPGLHRRPQPVRAPRRTAIRTCTAFRAASTRRTSRPPPATRPKPPTRRDLPHPRLGFFGVIDERFDLPLLDAMAACASGMADRDGRTGRENRSRDAAAPPEYPLFRASSRTQQLPRFWPAGTSA